MNARVFWRWHQHPYLRLIFLVLGKAGVGGINLLAFMLMAASVTATDMSAYAVDVAIVAVLSATSESSEFAYVRAVAESSRFARPVALLFMARAKVLTAALCMVLTMAMPLAGWVSGWDLPRWAEILPWVCLQAVTTLLLGAYTTWLAGADSQKAFTKVNLLNAVASMAAAGCVWLAGRNIAIYLVANIMLTFALLAWLYGGRLQACLALVRLACSTAWRARGRYQLMAQRYRPVYRSVLGVAFLSIIKNNTLIFVMGHQGNEQALATFAVAKRMFDFLHKGMAGFLEQLYVRLARMADQGRRKLELGVGQLYALRVVATVVAGAMLMTYFKLTGVGEEGQPYLVLASVMGAFLIMYFVTIATLMVSKYEPRQLFRSSVFAAIVYGIVPVVFANVSDPSTTPLAHVVCSVLSGLPLCLRTFSRHAFARVLLWYGVTLVFGIAAFLWFVLNGLNA